MPPPNGQVNADKRGKGTNYRGVIDGFMAIMLLLAAEFRSASVLKVIADPKLDDGQNGIALDVVANFLCFLDNIGLQPGKCFT
jgi:hypothetical protein